MIGNRIQSIDNQSERLSCDCWFLCHDCLHLRNWWALLHTLCFLLRISAKNSFHVEENRQSSIAIDNPRVWGNWQLLIVSSQWEQLPIVINQSDDFFRTSKPWSQRVYCRCSLSCSCRLNQWCHEDSFCKLIQHSYIKIQLGFRFGFYQ